VEATTPSTDPVRQPSSTMRIVAAILGNALEFYDFTIFATFAVMLGHAFFPTGNSLLLAVSTFGVGFLARPLGAIVIGAFADRFGRRPAMTLTIWLMALGSFMIGVLPTFQQIGAAAPLLLVVARLVQGFSAGGEMGPSTTYLIESAAPDRRGFFGSWQIASQSLGGIISGLVGVVLTFAVSPAATNAWGWRIPFLLGILIAPIGAYIRNNLDETLVAEKAHSSMLRVLRELLVNHTGQIVLCVLLISGGTIAEYFFIYLTSYALSVLGYSQTIAMTVTLTRAAVSMVFAVVGGLAADRFGIKPVALIGRLVATIMVYPILHLAVTSRAPGLLVLLTCVLVIPHSVSNGAAIVLIPKIFPAAVRTSGLSIAYALGVTIFGGTAQIVFTWIIGASGDKLSFVWYVVASGIISLLCILAIRLPKAWDAENGSSPGMIR
jgi:MFS family permease